MTKTIFSLLICGFLMSCASSNKAVNVQKKVVRDTVIVNNTKVLDYRIKKAEPKGVKVAMDHYPSPNQNERVRFIILHYTSADYETSVKLLTGAREVSSHYLVGDKPSDPIQLLVEENKRAWHAGRSYWRGRTNLNDSSIGIEIVNLTTTENGELFFVDYPKFQMKKVIALVKDLLERYPDVDPTNVIAHSDIAPQRKHDPGPQFPWKELYEKHDIGAWYDESDLDLFLPQFPETRLEEQAFILEVQQQLEVFGYKIDHTAAWDKQTKNVLRAFQYHFRPENYKGELDAETWAILQALIKKYRS